MRAIRPQPASAISLAATIYQPAPLTARSDADTPIDALTYTPPWRRCIVSRAGLCWRRCPASARFAMTSGARAGPGGTLIWRGASQDLRQGECPGRGAWQCPGGYRFLAWPRGPRAPSGRVDPDRGYEMLITIRAVKPETTVYQEMTGRWGYQPGDHYPYRGEATYRKEIGFINHRGDVIEGLGMRASLCQKVCHKGIVHVGIDGSPATPPTKSPTCGSTS